MSVPSISDASLTFNPDLLIFKNPSGDIFRDSPTNPGTLMSLDPINFPGLSTMRFVSNPRASKKMELIKAARVVLHSEGVLTVEDALAGMGFSGPLESFLKTNYKEFLSFGIKDSHKLRAVLKQLMDAEKLTSDERFLLHFMFAQVKNANRVAMAIDNLSDAAKTSQMMLNVKAFINKRITQYVRDETPEKFAAVHLPTTQPGLDIYCATIMIPAKHRHLDQILGRQTFSQLNVVDDLLSRAYEVQKNFWETVVVKTNNAANTTFKAEFREDFWKTSASDKYMLVDDNLKAIKPKDWSVGYTEQEVQTWMFSVKDLSA